MTNGGSDALMGDLGVLKQKLLDRALIVSED
jgi:hypothetical protein